MSANLDIVRSIYAGWEAGDFTHGEWADPQIEYLIVGGPVAGAWTGLDGMAVGWRGWLDGWAEYRTAAEQYRELDAERVLVVYNQSGRGKASGLELAKRWAKAACLFLIQNGKVTRLVTYFERDRVLADLGLAPEGDAA
jgi:hypothetical protein